MKPPKDLVCTKCGTWGAPKLRYRGSGWITFILLCCGIVLGVIYALWRRSTARWCCQACGSHELVPIDTPVGQKFVARALPAKAGY